MDCGRQLRVARRSERVFKNGKIKQSIPSLSTPTDRLLKFIHFSLIVAVDLDFSPFSFFLHTIRIGPYWEYRGEINLHIKSNISQLSQLISTTGRLCVRSWARAAGLHTGHLPSSPVLDQEVKSSKIYFISFLSLCVSVSCVWLSQQCAWINSRKIEEKWKWNEIEKRMDTESDRKCSSSQEWVSLWIIGSLSSAIKKHSPDSRAWELPKFPFLARSLPKRTINKVHKKLA